MNDVEEVTDAELAERYKFMKSVNKSIKIDADLFERYKKVRKQLEILEGEEKFLANKIKAQMKDRAKATVDGKTVITWIEHDYNVFDRLRLKEEMPDVYNEYVRNEPRRFFYLEENRKRMLKALRAQAKGKK